MSDVDGRQQSLWLSVAAVGRSTSAAIAALPGVPTGHLYDCHRFAASLTWLSSRQSFAWCSSRQSLVATTFWNGWCFACRVHRYRCRWYRVSRRRHCWSTTRCQNCVGDGSLRSHRRVEVTMGCDARHQFLSWCVASVGRSASSGVALPGASAARF